MGSSTNKKNKGTRKGGRSQAERGGKPGRGPERGTPERGKLQRRASEHRGQESNASEKRPSDRRAPERRPGERSSRGRSQARNAAPQGGADWITGFHGIEEKIAAGEEGILYISRKSDRAEDLIRRCRDKGWAIRHVKRELLDGRCGRDVHRGYAFEPLAPAAKGGELKPRYESVKQYLSSRGDKDSLVLVLDGITDPHNLGAIIRSADQFAVDLVVIPARRSAGETDTVARTSAGALEWVPLMTASNLKRTLEELREAGYWIYGADMGGTPAGELNLKGKTVLVMGSEGAGMSRIVKESCDGIVSIPMAGHVDSLNVSVAAGILLYEARRQ